MPGQVVNIPHGLKLPAPIRRFQSLTPVKLCRVMDELHIYNSSSHLPRCNHGFCEDAALVPSPSRSSPGSTTLTERVRD